MYCCEGSRPLLLSMPRSSRARALLLLSPSKTQHYRDHSTSIQGKSMLDRVKVRAATAEVCCASRRQKIRCCYFGHGATSCFPPQCALSTDISQWFDVEILVQAGRGERGTMNCMPPFSSLSTQNPDEMQSMVPFSTVHTPDEIPGMIPFLILSTHKSCSHPCPRTPDAMPCMPLFLAPPPPSQQRCVSVSLLTSTVTVT